MEETSMPNYVFIFNPMYDFLMSLVHLVNRSSMDEEVAEIGIAFDEELSAWVKEAEKKLPRSTMGEARFFFTKGLMPGLVALDVVRRENVQDLASLVARIAGMSPKRFLLGMLENVLCDPDPATGAMYTEETVPTDVETIRERIGCRCPVGEDALALFLDACMNPEDSQERLIRLLRKYEPAYLETGARFEVRSREVHERFSARWGSAPERFIEEVLSHQTEFFAADQQVFLAPSFFLDLGVITFLYSGEFGVRDSYLVYGTGVERRNWIKARKERRKLLFKALTEENRYEMLKKLARRDYYLLEMANELGLTSATASHHVSLLVQLGVVEMERDGNRIYYRLQKEPLKQLFEDALQEILQQESLK